MNTSLPLVSVIIPAYNSASWISDSLRSALTQSFQNLELILVNDGSTDTTHQLAEAIFDDFSHVPTNIIEQENLGVSSARNTGCLAARGSFLAFLDADDIWLPGKLDDQLLHLAMNPGLIAVSTGYQRFTGTDTLIGTAIHPNWYDGYSRDWLSLYAKGPLITSTMLVRRDAAIAAGLFDPDLSTAADADFAYRLNQIGSIGTIKKVLVLYRQSPTQMHRQASKLQSDYERLLTRSPFTDHPKMRRRCLALLRLRVARIQNPGVGGIPRVLSEGGFTFRYLDVYFGKLFVSLAMRLKQRWLRDEAT